MIFKFGSMIESKGTFIKNYKPYCFLALETEQISLLASFLLNPRQYAVNTHSRQAYNQVIFNLLVLYIIQVI